MDLLFLLIVIGLLLLIPAIAWVRRTRATPPDPEGDAATLVQALEDLGWSYRTPQDETVSDRRGWVPLSLRDSRQRAGARRTDESILEDRWIKVGEVFSPAAPVHRQDLFAGRHLQIEDLINAVFERGQHAAIFGERGVGKTSLATVITTVLDALENKLVVKVNCDTTDTFDSLWRKAIDEMQIVAALRTDERSENLRNTLDVSREGLQEVKSIRPNDVRKHLRMASSVSECVVFVDEFERLKDPMAPSLFAETIKILSDQSIAATIVLVGVADNLDDLLSEHGSIERALAQIHMPRMSREELGDIIERGLQIVDMKIDDAGRSTVVTISRGLPHFTHMITQSAARAAIESGEREISGDHVTEAIKKLSYRTQETILNAYTLATASRRNTIYPQVLLACALAPGDQQGFFTAADVVEPLSEVMGRPYPIPSFSRNLHALAEPARGPALQRRGGEHRHKFRFMNTLLQPYALMKGLAEGTIDEADLERFLGETVRES